MPKKEATGLYIGQITGLEEALRVLDDVKPRLQKTIVEKMGAEADQLAADIEGKLPRNAPLSGFIHSGRTSWARKGTTSAQRQSTSIAVGQVEWPIYKIMLGGYSSSIADIAGAGGNPMTAQGQGLIAGLNARYGRASRWVWPTAERHIGRVQMRMQMACDEIGEKVSKELAIEHGKV
jgi:hypothetical protein